MTHAAQLDQLGIWRANVPRYTSYPTANHFSARIGAEEQRTWLAALPAGSAVSLYVHIPFCKRLCWFCACRTQGTTSQAPIDAYLDGLIAEIALIRDTLPRDVRLSAVHWGGGTPTILSPDRMTRLADALRDAFHWGRDTLFSVEIDPTDVDPERIGALAAAGLRRASIGVQDFDPDVQAAIGRKQSFELTAEVTGWLRAHDVKSLNVDLLYGLPHQCPETLRRTLDQVLELSPDRLALFGYAHVPWMSKRQRLIPEDALPRGMDRRDLLELAGRVLRTSGYAPIGIDHFARPGDSLYAAQAGGRLRRNFQGYTDDQSPVLIGLGASAISQLPDGYVQNASATHAYLSRIRSGELSAARGHALDPDDRVRGRFIEALMCHFNAGLDALEPMPEDTRASLAATATEIAETAPDIAAFDGERLRILRNPELCARVIASRFDPYLAGNQHHSAAV